MADINKKIEKKYDFTANLYDILDYPFEAFRYKKIREKVWELCEGRILDAGIGTGRNIPFYPQNSKVHGIDLSHSMLNKARKRAKKHDKEVELEKMDMTSTSFPDNHFDTVVATFLFCVMPDELQPKALKEIKRICKDDGKIIFLEYEYSKKPLRKFFMKLFSPYVEFMYNARFDRKTLEHIKKEDFKILHNKHVYEDIIRMVVFQPKKEKRLRSKKAIM